jgi:hypothetical protein
MSIPATVADVLQKHVVLTVESIDRMFLKVMQPRLQVEKGIAYFFRSHRGEAFATAKVMAEMTRPFVAAMEAFADREKVPLITFEKGQRKDEVAQKHLAKFPHREGVLFVGKAQEKAMVVRTVSRKNPDTGRTYPGLMKSTAMVNHYFKEGRGLRTELTVNNTRDFRIGKALHNLPQLRELAFTANRRVLHVQQLSHDPTLGDDEFRTLTTPQVVDGQRISALPFGDETVLAVLSVLLMFRHLPQGFTNSELRCDVARLLARQAHDLKPGQMTYHLRRLRLRRLICRIPGSHRSLVTEAGLHTAQFYVCTLSRVIRPKITESAASKTLLNRVTAAIANLVHPTYPAKI